MSGLRMDSRAIFGNRGRAAGYGRENRAVQKLSKPRSPRIPARYPRRSEPTPKLPQCCQRVVQCEHVAIEAEIRAGFDPDQFRPNLADAVSPSAKTARCGVNCPAIPVTFGRCGRSFGKHRPDLVELGPSLADVWRVLDQLAQSWPTSASDCGQWPKSGPKWPKAATISRVWATICLPAQLLDNSLTTVVQILGRPGSSGVVLVHPRLQKGAQQGNP